MTTKSWTLKSPMSALRLMKAVGSRRSLYLALHLEQIRSSLIGALEINSSAWNFQPYGRSTGAALARLEISV